MDMKNKIYWILTLLLVSSFSVLTSCSDDETPADPSGMVGVELSSPMPEISSMQVGESLSVEFKAYTDWTITADQNWVKFHFADQDDEASVSLRGLEGKHHVCFTIGTEGLSFEEMDARISLSTAWNKVEFVVRRLTEERKLELLRVDEDEMGQMTYTPVEQLELAYNEWTESYHAKYVVRSNYKWMLDAPEWITLRSEFRSGDANSQSSDEDLRLYFINVDLKKATREDMTGALAFHPYNSAADTPITASVALHCQGTAQWRHFLPELPQLITFTPEGKYDSGMGTELESVQFSTLTSEEGLTFLLLAKSAGFSGDYYYGVMNDMYQMEYDASMLGWFGVDPSYEKESEEYPAAALNHYELWAGQASEERCATLLALPQSVADQITDLENQLFNDDFTEIRAEYQPYIVSEISQQAAAGGGLEFAFADMMGRDPEGITIEQMSEEELGQWAGDFGIQQGFVLTFDSFDEYFLSSLRLAGHEGSFVAMFDPESAAYDSEAGQGWIGLSQDGGFQEFQFSFTNQFESFTGSREVNVLLMDPMEGMFVAVIRVVQNVDNGNEDPLD